MARVKFDRSIKGFRGTVGGLTYSQWKDTATVSAKRQHNYIRSEAQLNNRNLHSILNRSWPYLSDEEQDQWKKAKVAMRISQRHNPETGNKEVIQIKGGFVTAQTAFVGTNILAGSVGQTKIIKAPRLDRPVPQIPRGLSAKFIPGHRPEQADCALTIKCDKLKSSPYNKASAAKDHFVRFCVIQVSKKFHRQIVGVLPVAKADKGITITHVRAWRGKPATLCLVGGKGVYIQADVVDKASGWTSSPCRTIRVVIDLKGPPKELLDSK